MTITRHYVLAAGGTGGHMMPAYALAAELMARGHHAALVTDDRGARIPGAPEGLQVHVLPAGRLGGGLIGWVRAAFAILKGRGMAIELMRAFEPSAVIGFGGYPALPALLGARALRIPTLIHDQNAVLGRVNRLIARRVDAIATSYPDVARMPRGCEGKVHLVGNPVRDAVAALRTKGFPPLADEGVFRLLVTGGSQGASVFADVVPDALALMPLAFRQRLQVTQQCRPEDIDRVRAAYADHQIAADLATFIEDMPAKLDWAHLVIARAGASTIAELTCAGRPAILVPLPSATDDHQTHNAREMAAVGGARVIAQPRFTVVELAKQMQKLALEPGALEHAATRALGVGRPHATRDLADLVERTGGAGLMEVIEVGSRSSAHARASQSGLAGASA
ncbi:MAG: undecaprenyldiphospho-muramoylpentapeptide beta-N-acetylglucosaminyltransferase [Sphingopyxis sp.]|nr:undecaprenyldiphospho-muramoylpentapeptide beta-N-acetylglucosaminyltransferase [Sphingopyxis sp.]